MGLYPSDLPVVLCAICGDPITFAQQATAVTENDGRQIHWDCWLKGERAVQPRSVTPTSKVSRVRTRSTLGAVALVLAVVGYLGFRLTWGLLTLGHVDSAIGRMRLLNAAEGQFAKEHPAQSYTCTLSELPSTIEVRRLLAKNSIDNGYAFEIDGCHAPEPQTPNSRYYITARPMHRGQPAFCSDQSGIVKADYSGSVDRCRSNGVAL